jgi:hypothetical protein
MAIGVDDRLKSSIKSVTDYARKVNVLLERRDTLEASCRQIPDSDLDSGDHVEQWKDRYEQANCRDESVCLSRVAVIS